MAQILDFLGLVADTLCARVDEDDGGELLVHVASTDDGVDVGLLDLEGQAPAELLLGTVAPDEWEALGVAARGWAHPLDGRAGGGGRRTRAISAVLVHRSGEVVGRLRVGDEVHTEAPAYGLTLDCLQRALGLPTHPPLVTTGELFGTMWLENVLGASQERSGALPWAMARTLHPAVQLLAGESSAIAGAEDPVAAGKALARVLDWDGLRWMAVEGRWAAGALTPTDAAWCDAGAFSRWVMDRRPSMEVLLAEVKRAAGSGVARRCAAVLHRLGVLSRSAA